MSIYRLLRPKQSYYKELIFFITYIEDFKLTIKD